MDMYVKYRISRNSGRGSYHFVRQILPQNWVNAVLILGAVIIYLVEMKTKCWVNSTIK